jgi:L-threonylcarbamoyladenylate synthase
MTELSDSLKWQVATYAEILKGGGVVAFPTETVYGLGASAWNPEAISKVFELKGRPADNPLIVHISSYAMLLQFAAEIPVDARMLMQKLWPGPLTLVFEKRKQVLDSISAGLPSVAIRMPDHALALRLIDAVGPLVAPSANKSGRPSPTNVGHVREDFGTDLPILDGGSCIVGLESTVVDVRTRPFRILRPGFISAKLIMERTGVFVEDFSESEGDVAKPVSPGMKYSHYAPETPVRWMTDGELSGVGLSDSALYLLHKNVNEFSGPNVINFNGDLVRYARELYDWFRRSDIQGNSEIVIQSLGDATNVELAKALNNRISKAICG